MIVRWLILSIFVSKVLGLATNVRVKLRRPMGLILEERDELGVQVIAIDPAGESAGKDIYINDVLLAVNQKRCEALPFENVMNLIASQPGDTVELSLSRPRDRVAIRFPNGIGITSKPGNNFKELAYKCRWPVRYSCDSGSCGTCEHQLLSLHDGEERYARLCVARVPKNAPKLEIISTQQSNAKTLKKQSSGPRVV